jgi:diguanylate cyclase (GGDEF)-like protein/putative nucleotidyltransferase with HDIG domain
MKFRKDSPIVTWLNREDKPLSREMIDIAPEFKGLWEAGENTLNGVEIELLCPIKSKRNLTGILALSKKQRRGFYSTDDIRMLMTLSHEAAVAIENAQLYTQAKKRANTDELTGLYNHRFFHQRLDEEIARCSRFGDIFSLLFIDLDFFKSYNNIYGHLAGDEILRQISGHIRSSLRRIDLSFRYGGDEFAVILPQTPLDGARELAERMRKLIEYRTESRAIPLTCSIGIASWPSDGVMREEIIRTADAALYYAKQTGTNRVCLASEVALSQVVKMEMPQGSTATIISTIYALAATVDAKDHYTYGHSKKVSQYATEIAEALNYNEEKVATIRAAALLHDIGKIGISDQLLGKSGPLSPEDWKPIHAHPNLGVAILKHVDALKGCLAAVQYHHERYDGTGYPANLKGENIPLDARILAVADAYDAMTSDRPYREAMSPEAACAEIERCKGTHFDPKIADVFLKSRKFATPVVR